MKKIFYVFLLAAFTFSSCSKEEGCTDSTAINFNQDAEEDDGSCEYAPAYLQNLPTTYNFQNVDYSTQRQERDMLTELTNYIKTANTSGVSVDSTTISQMFNNAGYTWQTAGLASATTKLSDRINAAERATYERYFGEMARASQSTVDGSNGQAGVVVSNAGDKAYLFDENGYEHIQLIEKGLMGSAFFYQAAAIYLQSGKMDVSSTSEMQSNFDNAFGYFGVPTDGFDGGTLEYWAKYSQGRDALIGSNSILNDFIKGRAAIDNNDIPTRDEAIADILSNWERMCAATAIYYVNTALANLTDDAIRNHALSEAYAFINSLTYNPNTKTDVATARELQNLLGANLYEVTTANLNEIKDRLAATYELEDVKNQL